MQPHPAELALKKAARLKGLHLLRMPGGFYALYKKIGGAVEPVGAWMQWREVAQHLGASKTVTLREALEHDGIVWPDEPGNVKLSQSLMMTSLK